MNRVKGQWSAQYVVQAAKAEKETNEQQGRKEKKVACHLLYFVVVADMRFLSGGEAPSLQFCWDE